MNGIFFREINPVILFHVNHSYTETLFQVQAAETQMNNGRGAGPE